MKNPLVTRPSYGQGSTATAELPGGGPVDRGLGLNPNLSGYRTHAKPSDDTREKAPEQSLYRTNTPRDLAKHQDQGDDLVDHSNASPAYMGLGEGTNKVKYPYRDDKSVDKEAQFVAELHILGQKTPLLLTHQEHTASRVAATAEQIMAGLNPKFLERSTKVNTTLKRADVKNMRWVFSVEGSQGNQYAVKVKAFRPRKNTTKFSKMDLEVSCSCPAWQWQGPEFHAKQQYQLGKAVGTAATPDIRDPARQNKVCKHVAAVLGQTRKWDIPVPKK